MNTNWAQNADLSDVLLRLPQRLLGKTDQRWVGATISITVGLHKCWSTATHQYRGSTQTKGHFLQPHHSVRERDHLHHHTASPPPAARPATAASHDFHRAHFHLRRKRSSGPFHRMQLAGRRIPVHVVPCPEHTTNAVSLKTSPPNIAKCLETA